MLARSPKINFKPMGNTGAYKLFGKIIGNLNISNIVLLMMCMIMQ